MKGKGRIAAVAIVVVGVAAVGGFLAADSGHSDRSHGGATPATTATASSPSHQTSPGPRGVFDVEHYGADPSGRTDSTLAIRATIAAAGAAGGWQTVYFPPGTYLLDHNDGAYQDFLLQNVKVNILGAGASTTKLIEKVGTYAYPNLKRGKTVFVFSHMRGFFVRGLTIDSQTFNAGDTIDDYGDDSTLEDLTLLGANNGSGRAVDAANVFDLRVIAVCNAKPSSKLYNVYHSGNVVRNIVLEGRGTGGNDDLDFACERDGTISNVVDTGWGTALYIDQNVTVSDYTFRPQGSRPAYRGFYITDSHQITITNFTTYGEGGIISSPSSPSSDITIKGEHMESPGFSLVIGDANNVTVEDSVLDVVVISPKNAANGVSFRNSSFQSFSCRARDGAVITGLVGATCG